MMSQNLIPLGVFAGGPSSTRAAADSSAPLMLPEEDVEGFGGEEAGSAASFEFSDCWGSALALENTMLVLGGSNQTASL